MWNYVTKFENTIKEIVGAPYGVAIDSCTHAIFISLLWQKEHGITEVGLPKRTYISVPNMCKHLDLKINWHDEPWKGSYNIVGTKTIDSACHFSQNTYIPGYHHCLSFHHRKTLSTVRGGMILTDDKDFEEWSRLMIYDGRDKNKLMKDDKPTLCAFHFYMPPETAMLGLENLNKLKSFNHEPIASEQDYDDVSYI